MAMQTYYWLWSNVMAAGRLAQSNMPIKKKIKITVKRTTYYGQIL
jgi:hypothetical protein